jgi:hypothetical protein
MYDTTINEYLEKVTNGMGPAQKREVQKELRAHILDSADALAAERKKPVDEDLVREVIEKMVPPSKLGNLYPAPSALLQMKRLRQVFSGLILFATMFLLVAGILWIVSPDTLGTIPATVILSIVGTLVLLFLALTIIFTAMYMYESMTKRPFMARRKRPEKSLADAGTPGKVFMAIFGTIVWLAIINLFWQAIPFLSNFGTNARLIPLFSHDFAGFLLWYNLLGILTIVVHLMFLAVRSKWLTSLLRAMLSICNAILTLWLLSRFPFNPELSGGVQSGIRVLLAVLIMLTLIDAASKLWKTIRLYGMSMAAKSRIGGLE